MQPVGQNLLNILLSSERDLIDLVEIYDSTETNLFPSAAVRRFARSEIIWSGWKYERQAITRGDISRYIDGKFNNVTISLSNVDRAVSSWLALTDIEGFRLVVRTISRSVDEESLVGFVGRCEKPVETDNRLVQITAKQDLGSIENTLPPGQCQSKCPLRFKGVECLGGQLLSAKSAAYQAATTCNKSYEQCVQYLNWEFFQGFRFNAIQGTFKVSERRGGAGGAVLGLVGLGNHKVTKQYSSQDDSAAGRAIPFGLGRTQVEFVPTEHADTGEFLAGRYLIGEGEITSANNVHTVTAGWASTFQSYYLHKGKYGNDAEQTPLGFFAGLQGDRYSHRANVEITIEGENPDTGDPVPTIVGMILWHKIPVFEDSCFTGVNWSDNPVEHVRYLLTEPRSLNYPAAWINNEVAAETARYCNEPLIDTTGAEDLYVSTALGVPGISYKRYRTTGLLDTEYYRWILGVSDYDYPPERETGYHTYDPAAPPTSVTATTFYRRRYTSNWHLKDPIKAADFLFKALLACARLYLITGADGRLQIKAEKPTPTSFLTSAASAAATAIQIQDAASWQRLNLPIYYALIGVGRDSSETRRVTSITYSTAGNSITLTASSTMGTSAVASGATLSGGSVDRQAEGRVTFGGTPSDGEIVTVTIGGTAVTYPVNSQDSPSTIAAQIAMRINANEVLNKYVEAKWTTAQPTICRIYAKNGTLNLATGLTTSHGTDEQVIHVHMPFSDVAAGALTRGNIIKDSFKWPLGSKQSSYNQFKIVYNDTIQDFQEVELRENDYDHQDKLNKVNTLEIAGGCIDNYHQAYRLVTAAKLKYRDGDFFTSLGTAGVALLLEEGDIYCVSHGSMPGRRNVVMRIEELKVSPEHKVSIVGRLYIDDQIPNTAEASTILLTSGVGWPTAVPGAVTTLILTSPASGVLAGTFTFAGFIGTQQARVEVLRAGETSYSDTGIRVTPDSSNQGAFEISGLPAGVTFVRITPFSTNGDGPQTVGSYDTTADVIDVLEYQIFDLVDTQPNLEAQIFT